MMLDLLKKLYQVIFYTSPVNLFTYTAYYAVAHLAWSML
jgi:hypothetical protein